MVGDSGVGSQEEGCMGLCTGLYMGLCMGLYMGLRMGHTSTCCMMMSA